jgi:hypothetical protein
MIKQTKKYYFVATKEEELEIDDKIYKNWTIDNASGSPHESRKDALNEMEYFKYSIPCKLIVIESKEDINSSKEANKEVMEEVNYKIEELNV